MGTRIIVMKWARANSWMLPYSFWLISISKPTVRRNITWGIQWGGLLIQIVLPLWRFIYLTPLYKLKQLIWLATTQFAPVVLNSYKRTNHHSLCVCEKISDHFTKKNIQNSFGFVAGCPFTAEWRNLAVICLEATTRQISVSHPELINSLKRCVYVYSRTLLQVARVAFDIKQPPLGTLG